MASTSPMARPRSAEQAFDRFAVVNAVVRKRRSFVSAVRALGQRSSRFGGCRRKPAQKCGGGGGRGWWALKGLNLRPDHVKAGNDCFEPRLVPIGTFFFRHRNWAFPVLVAGFFLLTAPPSIVRQRGPRERQGLRRCFISFAGLTLRALVIGHDYVSRAGEAKSIHASRLLYAGNVRALPQSSLHWQYSHLLGIFLMHGNLWIFRPGLVELRIHLSRDRRRRGGLPPSDLRRRLRRVSRFDTPLDAKPVAAPGSKHGSGFQRPRGSSGRVSDDRHYDHRARPRRILRGILRAKSRRSYLVFLGGIIAAGVVWVAVVRVIKKRRWVVAA